MEVRFNVTKEERKALVAATAEIVGWAAVYKGAPSFAYAVNNYIIDKNGTLSYDGRTEIEDVRILIANLSERGFIPEELPDGLESGKRTLRNEDSFDDGSDRILDRLDVEIPLDGFTQTALDNLERLVSGKAALIMKAVGAYELPIERTESALRFPWFRLSDVPGETDAYIRFISALCEMAKKQKRVTLKETKADSDSSEKFAFRCFLLRLGFIGKEYSAARKILLSKLSGSASFKNGFPNNSDVQKAVTAAGSGAENTPDGIVEENETGANIAGTSGDSESYAYNPNLSAYDALMKGEF